MPAIIQHQLLGMKANVVSYNAIIDGVHAMGPHRLLATSGCDIGIEFLIVIVMVSFVFECCMFGASAPLSIWLLLDVCRRSLRSKSLAALNVAGDTMTYNSPIRCCTARSQATPNVASAGARSSSGLSLAGGDELTRAMELIILIDVASPRVSRVGFTIFTFTFYVHLSSLCVWLLSFAFCLYNVTFYMWLIKCSLVARN